MSVPTLTILSANPMTMEPGDGLLLFTGARPGDGKQLILTYDGTPQSLTYNPDDLGAPASANVEYLPPNNARQTSHARKACALMRFFR